jgi:hypothetical protein
MPKQKSIKKGLVALAILLAFASIACVCGVQYSANVIAEDTSPPLVTEPSANPDVIAANGVQESRLSVTVTDQSGIYSVTVDLSSLGGPEAEEMVKTDGLDVYTATTTAAFGTPPETYELRVNATDDSTSRNSNTSVCISLTVTEPPVITYDFSTDAGSDKWAYRKQHKANPPAKKNVPKSKFSTQRYKNIKAQDGRMQIDATSRKGNYAIHRFKFKIAEDEASINEIRVLWTGIGFRLFGTHGATLYIWNFETGAYEQQDRDTSFYSTLEGTVSGSIGDYIDNKGNLIVIAEQNSPQRRFRWWNLRSRIGTDYVKVDITC